MLILSQRFSYHIKLKKHPLLCSYLIKLFYSPLYTFHVLNSNHLEDEVQEDSLTILSIVIVLGNFDTVYSINLFFTCLVFFQDNI